MEYQQARIAAVKQVTTPLFGQQIFPSDGVSRGCIRVVPLSGQPFRFRYKKVSSLLHCFLWRGCQSEVLLTTHRLKSLAFSEGGLKCRQVEFPRLKIFPDA
jgi:hypothetical protein